MTTETKTRSVPVQRTRNETKTRTLADGSIQSYQVSVPYTENVTQNTEQITQSYTVQVPYTANGKRIEKADYGKYGLDAGALSQATEKEALVASNRSIDLLRDAGRSLGKQLSQQEVNRTQQLSTLQGQLESSIQIFNGQSVATPAISDPSSIGSPIGPSLDANKNKPFSPPPAPAFAESSGVNGASQQSLIDGTINVDGGLVGGDASGSFGGGGGGFGGRFSAHNGESDFRMAQGSNGKDNSRLYGYQGLSGEASDGSSESGSDSAGGARRPAEFLAGGEIPFEESAGKRLSLGVDSAKDSSSRASVAGERRIIKQLELLELHRDQLAVTQNLGPGHTTTQALDLAINERKARLAALAANTGEQYEPIFENAFLAAKGPTGISTFSIDVDTASYANMSTTTNNPPANIRFR